MDRHSAVSIQVLMCTVQCAIGWLVFANIYLEGQKFCMFKKIKCFGIFSLFSHYAQCTYIYANILPWKYIYANILPWKYRT